MKLSRSGGFHVSKSSGLLSRTRQVKGTTAMVHTVVNPTTKKYVTVVEHTDQTFNMRDDNDRELYDGSSQPDLLDLILKLLLG